MSDTSIATDAPATSQTVTADTAVTEKQWIEARRQQRRQERAAERAERAQPAEEPVEVEPAELEPEGEPVVEEAETEAEEVTREAAEDDAAQSTELLSEDGEAPEDTDADAEQSEFPDTMVGLAESLGYAPDELMGHLQVTVNPNGVKEDVTLSELAKGYMREADYTRKTTALAEQRKANEAEVRQSLERQKASIERLDNFALALGQEIDMGLSDADLDRLKDEDRYRWIDEKDKRERKIAAYNQAVALRQRAVDEAQAQQAATFRTYRAEQQKRLKEKMPEMGDAEKGKKIEADLRGFLTSDDIGFSDQEVTDFFNGGFDHRQVLVIARAAEAVKQAKAQTKVAKKVKKLPKLSTSKARRSQAQQSGSKMRSVKQKLRTEQSTEAALDMLKQRRLSRRNASHGRGKSQNVV